MSLSKSNVNKLVCRDALLRVHSVKMNSRQIQVIVIKLKKL